jgi:hypothetical protein
MIWFLIIVKVHNNYILNKIENSYLYKEIRVIGVYS